MGLTTTLNNAVSGLRVNQDAIDILSRNVANQGTPGYHRQSLTVLDYNNTTSSYANSVGTTRAFNTSLQTYYTRQVAETASAGVQASYLDRLQGYLGKPGSAGSLDTLYGNLENALQGLATSPDDYTARAEVAAKAQSMAETLNRLSTDIQGMRQEVEGQISTNVQNLNGMLNSLAEVNARVLNLGTDDASRAALLDQRDRLISSVSEVIDVRADYRSDGTVSLSTRSGVGLLDNGASQLKFESGGKLSPGSLYNSDPNLSGVGDLTLTTQTGLKLDLVRLGAIKGGELGGLLTLRDTTLVEAQAQLDEIASGLAQAFSTVQTPGTAVAGGFSSTLTGLQSGDSLLLNVKVGGVDKAIKVVNTTNAGVDYTDALGTRVIGIDLGAGSVDAAQQLQDAFNSTANGPALAVTVDGSGGGLAFTASGTTQVSGLTKRATATDLQGGGLGLPLFMDGKANYTNTIDGSTSQKLGFASRISVNSAVLADNSLLVQSQAGQTLGDAARPNYLIGQLDSLNFVSGADPRTDRGKFQLNGNVGELISQTISFQGNNIAQALTRRDDRQLTLDTVIQQMDSEYGVDVDEEMSRLLQLQNAYSANARVVGVVKELLDALLNAV